MKNEEKFKRLSKIVHRYKDLCDFIERVSKIFYDLEKIKSN